MAEPPNDAPSPRTGAPRAEDDAAQPKRAVHSERGAVGADGPPAEPVFAAPWQAQAFAMTLALHRQGLFTWTEWAATLAEEIARAQAAGDPDRGDTYYVHWLAALERLVAAKGASSADELARHRDAWDRAADRTPHGQAIELRPEDFG